MLERIHLSIVQQVEKEGSLTAAAGVLNLTQSALSHSMKKLEQQLGTDIWLREGRRLRLTQAGQYLLAVANRVLPQLDLAEERLGQFAQGERGALRIGMECHPCYQWLLKVVAPYLAAWPDVDVDVKQKFQFGGIGALFGYEIDLLVTPDPLFKPGLKFEPVFDYEQVLVVAKGHPLASVAYVKPEQLTQELPRDGTGRDTCRGLPCAGPLEHRAGVVEAVLEHAREVGVTGPGPGQRRVARHIKVLVGDRV